MLSFVLAVEIATEIVLFDRNFAYSIGVQTLHEYFVLSPFVQWAHVCNVCEPHVFLLEIQRFLDKLLLFALFSF